MIMVMVMVVFVTFTVLMITVVVFRFALSFRFFFLNLHIVPIFVHAISSEVVNESSREHMLGDLRLASVGMTAGVLCWYSSCGSRCGRNQNLVTFPINTINAGSMTMTISYR